MPTFWSMLKRSGLRAALNFKAERICIGVLNDSIRFAKSHGNNMFHKDWKNPWWFKWISRFEFYTRPKRKVKF